MVNGLKRVLATDIDGTLVGHGGEDHFIRFVHEHPGLAVVYLTGRTRHNAEAVIRRYGFPPPIAMATEVGAEIYWGKHMASDDIWAFQLRQDWSPRKVRKTLEALPGVFYRSRSSHWRLAFSVDGEDVVEIVRHRLRRERVQARVLFDPSDGRLDVLPARAQKCRALSHILTRVAVRPRQCFVAGDGENDRDLMQGRFPGVVVANAVHALRDLQGDSVWLSRHPGAMGVVEGLRRWYAEFEGGEAKADALQFYG